MIFLYVCSQLVINSTVGNEIDSAEAKKYQLFTDIEGFESAQFVDVGDSIVARLKILEGGVVKDSAVVIDVATFKSLSSYIHNFRMIIEDGHFRRTFIQTFKIGWPIVSQSDIDRVVKSSTGSLTQQAACCMTGGCALGAYTAALLTRDIRTEIDTVGLPAPCLTGEGIGCISIPLVIERKYYSYSEVAYIAGAGAGSGLGYLYAKTMQRPNDVLYRTIGHDIVTFDNEGFPITEQQIKAANRGTSEALLGTLGIGCGLIGAGVTCLVLLSPWADKYAEEEWQENAITASAVVVSAIEFGMISMFFVNKGKQIDRRATIERLKDRHYME